MLQTGLPMMRALWLHHPDDPNAIGRGDQYLWGRDVLVSPVVEKDATSRRLYLPKGEWFDFWTEERITGGPPRRMDGHRDQEGGQGAAAHAATRSRVTHAVTTPSID
jgi:alpha-glucosidase (family GH31 glycosyl hydrolase)